MYRIELDDFLVIAEAHTGTSAGGLACMPRVLQLAEAALAAPFEMFSNYEAFPALHEKAGVYCSRIVTYRPLPRGNKHTAYDVMREFLERNGATFSHPPGGTAETAGVLEDLAAGELEEGRLIEWVAQRID